MTTSESGTTGVASVEGTAFADVLRPWVDVFEPAEREPVSPVDSEPISPELVLVDPDLRRRIAELPTGPSLPPVLRIVEVEAPRPRPVERSGGLGLVASIAYALALILALPVLALAADFVRSGGPRLAPRSGQVHVSLQKHVVPEPPRTQTLQNRRPG